jgi:hypothetical protein
MDKYCKKYLTMIEKNIAKFADEDGRANIALIINKVYEDGFNDGSNEILDGLNRKRIRQGLDELSLEDTD